MVERHQAARASALPVREVDRWRVHVGGQRAVTASRGAMACRALCLKERGTALQVGQRLGCDRDRIGSHEQSFGLVSQPCHLGTIDLASDGLLQLVGSIDHGLLGSMRRQCLRLSDRIGGEVPHLRVLGLADNSALVHRTTIVHGHIVEQLPQLAWAFIGLPRRVCATAEPQKHIPNHSTQNRRFITQLKQERHAFSFRQGKIA